MKRFKVQQTCLAFMMFILSVFLITGCGSNGQTGHWLPAPAKELVSIHVTPVTASIPIGAPKQFMATATYEDGTSADVTASAIWTSGAAGVATVNSTSGLATGLAEGTASITADFGGKSDSGTLTVMPASVTLSSIAVTPLTASIPIGLTQSFVATGYYSDSSNHDISASVTWTSGTPGVATVVSPGIATGVTAGTTIITAAFGGKSGAATLTVLPAEVSSITIVVTPATASIPMGLTQQFVATGTYSNGHSYDISNAVVWTSSATGVATVVSPGIATGLSVGTTTITATLNCGTCETNKSGSAKLTVTAAILKSIAVTPKSATVEIGVKQAFIAIGTYSDGTSLNISNIVTWSSSTGHASVLSTGVAAGVSVGDANIIATLGALSDFGVLHVIAAVIPPITTPSCAGPGPVDMGAAASFGVLVGPAGGATFSITNPTSVTGNTGAKSYVPAGGVSALTGTKYTGTDQPYVDALAAMLTAISCASARACTVNYAAGAIDFGGMTLAPGVHCVIGAMSVGSPLTISTPGVYIFRSSGALDTAVNVNVTFGSGVNDSNTWLFWVPSGAATIKAGTAFIGTIMPDLSAASTMSATATLIPGRLFSNSAVTVNTNTIQIP